MTETCQATNNKVFELINEVSKLSMTIPIPDNDLLLLFDLTDTVQNIVLLNTQILKAIEKNQDIDNTLDTQFTNKIVKITLQYEKILKNIQEIDKFTYSSIYTQITTLCNPYLEALSTILQEDNEECEEKEEQ
ncbi:Hypothetical_protein [Hexamita inflata]|uniref:Hypothetical_protein n=1 Tax=Hexamita inflata TaxID=28002 RepID=A0AA86VMC3_9EUKA|nr:Hypothetical protein HINF_LOCUS58398 [Hexamita inflata]